MSIMKNKYFKVNRRYVAVLTLGFLFLTISNLSFCYHNIRAESLSDPNPVVLILGGLLRLVMRPEVRPGTSVTPTPNVPSCTNPNDLYPYVKFGLDYHIPFRDPTVRPSIDLRQALQSNSIPKVGGKNAKIEYIDTIISMSTSRGWNPAFMLSLWLEETEGSHSTVKPYGDAPGIPGSNCGVSHTGYGPCYGGVRPIDVELGWIFNARDKYRNEKFAHFMAGWSGGGCVDTDGDGRPDGGADAYFNNICTMNPFINNPNFTKNLKAVYSYLVPPGTHGALTEASQAGNAVCPTATPTSAASPSDPAFGRDIIQEVRSVHGDLIPCAYSPYPKQCIRIDSLNANTIMSSVHSATEDFKAHVRRSVTVLPDKVLQCVGAVYALSSQINGVVPQVGHRAACQFTDTTSVHQFYQYGDPGTTPLAGDIVVWDSGGKCDPETKHYGHVAYILSVRDSHNVDVGEGNWGLPGNLSIRTVDFGLYAPMGFLRKL